MVFSRMLSRRYVADQSGQVAILFALMALPVFGIAGMAMDYGRAMSASRKLQASIDAAVLAGAKSEDDREEAAQKFFTANLESRGDIAASAVTVNFSTDSDGNLVGSASSSVPTTIMQVLGFDALTVTAAATAKPGETTTRTETETITKTVTTPGGVPCIQVQDQNAQHSLKLINNHALDARTCEVYLRSNDKDAILTDNEIDVRWKKIHVKGAGGTLLGSRDIIMDAPNVIKFDQSGVPITGSPYSDSIRDVAQAIAVGACSNANTGKNYTNTTVQPGTYCGATTFNGVTFAAGLYIIASGQGNKSGALTLSGVLNGAAGVSFFLADNKSKLVSYTAGAGTVLMAPTSGTSRGLLFFEDSNRGQNWTLSIASMSQTVWSGAIYLPSGNLILKSWTPILGQATSFSIVANQIEINGWSGVANAYAWTPFNRNDPITLPATTTTTSEVVTKVITETSQGRLMH